MTEKQLPKDVIINMLTELNPRELSGLCQGNKRIRKICKDYENQIWNIKLKQDFGVDINLPETYGKLISTDTPRSIYLKFWNEPNMVIIRDNYGKFIVTPITNESSTPLIAHGKMGFDIFNERGDLPDIPYYIVIIDSKEGSKKKLSHSYTKTFEEANSIIEKKIRQLYKEGYTVSKKTYETFDMTSSETLKTNIQSFSITLSGYNSLKKDIIDPHINKKSILHKVPPITHRQDSSGKIVVPDIIHNLNVYHITG